jgi:lipoyl(octanoyl) transferase
MKHHYPTENELGQFGLSPDNLSVLNHRTIVVTRWEWDYEPAYAFQKFALKKIQESPELRVLICCSHPEVLTHGRGLQRSKPGENLNLIPFENNQSLKLPYPIFKIERGGGLTFHHPGQFIFYPILKLNPHNLSLSKMIHGIFENTISVLREWGIQDLTQENKLLGIWHHQHKLASMGIAIEKLTTFHGMALNLRNNPTMMNQLKDLNPCGLNFLTYKHVDELIDLSKDSIEEFKLCFLKRIEHEWK